MPEQRTTRSGLDFVSEVADLAGWRGIHHLHGLPFALPALALTALAARLLFVAALVGAVLVAPILVLGCFWRSRDRDLMATRRVSDGEAPGHHSPRSVASLRHPGLAGSTRARLHDRPRV